jgi:hypothetical protein
MGLLMTGGGVCSLQLLLGIANTVLFRSDYHRTHEHYLPVFCGEREGEEKEVGVVVRDATFGVGVENTISSV